jgi:hypothetical protein
MHIPPHPEARAKANISKDRDCIHAWSLPVYVDIVWGWSIRPSFAIHSFGVAWTDRYAV